MIGIGVRITGIIKRWLDNIAPSVLSIEVGAVADNKITITHSETLDATVTIPTASYTLSGTSVTVTDVDVSGRVVTLTLSGNIYDSETVLLTYISENTILNADGSIRTNADGSPRYSSPVGNVIKDLAGNQAANLDEEEVTNNSSVHLPFESDLDTYYDAVSSNEFIEEKQNLPATFIPSCFLGDNTGSFTLPASAWVFNNNDFEIEFDFFMPTLSAIQYIAGMSYSGAYRWYLRVNDSGSIVFYTEYNDIVAQIITNTEMVSANTYSVIKITVDRDGTNIITVNDVPCTFITNNQIANFDHSGTKQILGYATNMNTGTYCSYIKTTIGGVLAEHYVLPHGYDISGNGRHATKASVSSANISYLVGATTHLNDIGYSLWEHASSDPIQVPYNLVGEALSLVAGTNIPAGYSKILDIPHVSNKWNMADCLVGFNETGAADTELEIFDRENTTIQSAISRASDYYDDTSLATRSRYHITEIADPRIYFEFFNAGYAGRIFGKVDLELISSTYYFKYYDEQLNYATDKTGDDEYAIMGYCNVHVFAE